jgi:Ca2+-dependent lipid-binding protein
METFIVITASVVIPLVTIGCMIVYKRHIESERRSLEREQAEQEKLISIMEDIIETKSNTINLLK